jgi:predicted RNase H-like HicB family nuclease
MRKAHGQKSTVRGCPLPAMVLCNQELIMKTFTAVIEKCPDTQLFVGYVPGFPGAHTQAASLHELHKNLQEVLQLLLEEDDPKLKVNLLGHRPPKAAVPDKRWRRCNQH